MKKYLLFETLITVLVLCVFKRPIMSQAVQPRFFFIFIVYVFIKVSTQDRFSRIRLGAVYKSVQHCIGSDALENTSQKSEQSVEIRTRGYWVGRSANLHLCFATYHNLVCFETTSDH